MIGETVRTPVNDAWHAIVGHSGEPYWDVSPTRAGLSKVIKYGVLAPVPEEWVAQLEREQCSCAACGAGAEVRECAAG